MYEARNKFVENILEDASFATLRDSTSLASHVSNKMMTLGIPIAYIDEWLNTYFVLVEKADEKQDPPPDTSKTKIKIRKKHPAADIPYDLTPYDGTGNFTPGSGDQIIDPEDFGDEDDNPDLLNDDEEEKRELNEEGWWWDNASPAAKKRYLAKHKKPPTQRASTGKKKAKKKAESATERKKRREAKNEETATRIENGDDDTIAELMSERRAELAGAEDLPAGTPGSTLGEVSGGVALEQLIDNPDLSQEGFVDSELEKLRGTQLWDELAAKAKGSKQSPEEYIKGWLEVGYRTGQGELAYLKSEPKFRYKDPQRKPFPITATMDYNQQQIVKSTLEKKLKEAKTPEEKAHYKKQLGYLEKLSDTDTGVMYETDDGYIGFKHTSNKKDWNAPHNNTSVAKKAEKISEFVKHQPGWSKSLRDSVEETTANVMDKAADTVAGSDAGIDRDVSALAASETGVKGFAELMPTLKPSNKDYVEQARTQSTIKKQLESKGIDPSEATDEEISQAVFDVVATGEAPQDVKKLVLKASDIVEKVGKLREKGLAKYGGPMTDEQIAENLGIPIEAVRAAGSDDMQSIAETSRDRKDSMKKAHKDIVTDLQAADTELDPDSYPNNPDGDNGPNQQAYVDSFLDDIHFSRYIDGELEGVQSINIDGNAVTPEHFQKCLTQMSGYKGYDHESNEPMTKKQRADLKDHLRRKLRVSPESSSVSIGTADEKREIGQEEYRTKGDSKSILASLGKGLTGCLKKRTGASK